MGQAELRAVFKLINSPENKKVLDDNKNDIQRSVSGLAKDVQKSMGGDIFKGASASFIKNNPELFTAAKDSGRKFAEEFSRGMKTSKSPFGGGADLAKAQALPDINDLEPKLNKAKLAIAAIATLFNPFVGSRLLSDAIPKGMIGGGGGSGGGIGGAIFGAAGAAGYGEIFVVVKALEYAFKTLVGAIKKTIEAYDNATKIYAKSLMSGLGVGFTVKRGMLAEVLGVDEKDVLRFGYALAYLSPRLQFATDEISKSTIP